MHRYIHICQSLFIYAHRKEHEPQNVRQLEEAIGPERAPTWEASTRMAMPSIRTVKIVPTTVQDTYDIMILSTPMTELGLSGSNV